MDLKEGHSRWMDQSLEKRDAASSRCVQRKQLIHLDQWNEDLYQPAQPELGCRVYVNAKERSPIDIDKLK